jgi:hypothetical protein
MPIRAENRALYPADWPAISLRIRDRAQQCCERCGVRNHALGGRDARGLWCEAEPLDCSRRMPAPGTDAWCYGPSGWKLLRIVRVVLTVAHLDHDPRNCAETNLQALCQACHNRLDARMRAAGLRARRRAALAVQEMAL